MILFLAGTTILGFTLTVTIDRARHSLISGRVQGVGYRAFAKRAAAEAGAHGWARNLSDGRVEVMAYGTTEALDRLSEHLRIGPAQGVVTGVVEADLPDGPRPPPTEFEIRKDATHPCSAPPTPSL